MGVFTTIWFLWGGTRNLFALFRTLKLAKRNALDDGSVDQEKASQVELTEPAGAEPRSVQ